MEAEADGDEIVRGGAHRGEVGQIEVLDCNTLAKPQAIDPSSRECEHFGRDVGRGDARRGEAEGELARGLARPRSQIEHLCWGVAQPRNVAHNGRPDRRFCMCGRLLQKG